MFLLHVVIWLTLRSLANEEKKTLYKLESNYSEKGQKEKQEERKKISAALAQYGAIISVWVERHRWWWAPWCLR